MFDFNFIWAWMRASYDAAAGIDKFVLVAFAVLLIWDLLSLNLLGAAFDVAIIAYILWSISQ